MPIADSINASDRDLMKRLTIVLAIVFASTAALSYLHGTYANKFYDITGRAQWIWAQHRLNSNEPVAFFAARDFDLPRTRVYARLRILGDPEYTVFLNGREIAARRVGEQRALDEYDITSMVRDGRNRIVVAVRAPQGVGGLIAAIAIANAPNHVVTDRSWQIYRWWNPSLLVRDVPTAAVEAPFIIGEPPVGRWNYLTLVDRKLSTPATAVLEPRTSFRRIGLIPRIRTTSGVAVAGQERARATVSDFGFTTGRVRLVMDSPPRLSRLFNVRFANVESELGLGEWNLRPVVFAPGETVVTTPEEHHFRYVMVFGEGVRTQVVKEKPEE